MLDKTVDQNKRLQQARADLDACESALIVSAASKAEAASSGAEAYSSWRAKHEALVSERERLTIMIESLERELSASNAADADAEFRKRYAGLEVEIAKLADRTGAVFSNAASTMLSLAREHALVAIEIRKINQSLPDDLSPLTSPDFLARGIPALPREVIKTERIWLWTYAETGGLVGDQDHVVDQGDGRGIIPPPEGLGALTGGKTLRNKQCLLRLFDQVTVHPEQSAERLTPLWQVRLVDPHGPRVLFDGTDILQPADALAALEGEPKDGTERATG